MFLLSFASGCVTAFSVLCYRALGCVSAFDVPVEVDAKWNAKTKWLSLLPALELLLISY